MKKEESGHILARHRFLDSEVSIPIKSVRLGLRRPLRRIDVTKMCDYIIVSNYKGLEKITELSMGTKDTSFMKPWQKYVEGRMGSLAVLRRFDISASGTTILAFYSSVPMVAGVVMWPVHLSSDEDAKILTLWLNSSLNILQILLNRSETRGAFLEVGKYMLDDFLVLNLTALEDKNVKFLLKTFDKVKDIEFPNILNQLKSSFYGRVEIDRAIFRVLGLSEEEATQIIERLYPALAEEIEKLKTMMEG